MNSCHAFSSFTYKVNKKAVAFLNSLSLSKKKTTTTTNKQTNKQKQKQKQKQNQNKTTLVAGGKKGLILSASSVVTKKPPIRA